MNQKCTRQLTRRSFLATSAMLALARRAGASAVAQQSPLCVFSKHLQWLEYGPMAAFAASIGFDGVDLTVRPKGHVKPARVRSDLPRAVTAIKAAGLVVPTITTAINDAQDALTEAILETAAEQGIKYYRMGYFRYDENEPVETTLARVIKQLSALARLNERYGITGDVQNHAGRGYFGASIWDTWFATRELDPRWIGCQFDLRHATVEGAMSWPVDFRLVQSRTHTLVAKDFRWEDRDGKTQVTNCPLGQGVSDFPELFRILRKSGFSGPISVHYEYPLGGVEHGARDLSGDRSEVANAMKRDLGVLRSWLKNG